MHHRLGFIIEKLEKISNLFQPSMKDYIEILTEYNTNCPNIEKIISVVKKHKDLPISIPVIGNTDLKVHLCDVLNALRQELVHNEDYEYLVDTIEAVIKNLYPDYFNY